MTQTPGVLQWGSQERAVFFRPWWRAALTLTLAAIPIALTPLFASSPETGTWLGVRGHEKVPAGGQ